MFLFPWLYCGIDISDFEKNRFYGSWAIFGCSQSVGSLILNSNDTYAIGQKIFKKCGMKKKIAKFLEKLRSFPEMKSSKIGEDRTTIRLSKCHNFFSIENLPNNVYIIYWEKVQISNFLKNNMVLPKKATKTTKQHFSKICNLGIWHIPIYFAVSQGQPRPNVRHFFGKGGRFIKIKNWFQLIFGRF